MATNPAVPQGNPGAAPAAAPGGSPPSQAPANPMQVMLAQIYQVLKRMAGENNSASAGLQKACAGIQEAQSAMMTQPRPQPTEGNPPQ
jgi:membrane-bound lytic murein transglycosylase B